MKAKKIYFIVIGILLIILGIVLWSYYNRDEIVTNKSEEIIPQEEISDEQLRNTIVSLFFINKDTEEIEAESKLIDVKKLINNPYEEIINLWLLGPNNEKLKSNCSNNTKLNSTKIEGDCIVVDFSKEFVEEYKGEKNEESKVIYCLVNTLTELTEVNSVKILIDGEENKYLGDFNLSEKYFKLNN